MSLLQPSRFKILLRLFLLLFGVCRIMLGITYAQDNSLKFSHINISQGMSNSTIEAIFQDYRGFIWFGTRDGINRYDGYQMTIYKNSVQNIGSISDNYIRCIGGDNRHAIWVGTGNGLNRFDAENNKFIRFNNVLGNNHSISGNKINCIFNDRSGEMWVGTADGRINLYNPSSNSFTRFSPFEKYRGATVGEVTCLLEDKKGGFWVGSTQGLFLFDRKHGSFFHPAGMISQIAYNITSLQEDRTGNIWVGLQDHGLIRMSQDGSTITQFRHDERQPGSLATNQIKCLFTDHNGRLLIGSINGGLSIYNDQANIFLNYQNIPENSTSLSQRTVSSIFEDNQHNLWVGTHRGGINLYTPGMSKFRLFQSEPKKNSLTYNDIRAFSEDNEHKIWIGTDGGGLNLFDPKSYTFEAYKNEPFNKCSLSSNAVLSIMNLDNRRVCLSTWGGGINLFDRKSKKFTYYINDPADSNSISSNYVYKCFKDTKENFWVITYYGGVNLFDVKSGKFRRFTKAPDGKTKLKGCNFVSVGQDGKQNIWFGTDDGGLNRYNLQTGKIKHYFDQLEEFPDLQVIFIDRKGRIWVGQRGLYLYDPLKDSFKLYTGKADLDKEFIKGIEEDVHGDFWISTSNGLIKFNPDSFKAKIYNFVDGLQGQEFEPNANLLASDGTLYFGGLNGFNQFKPDSVQANHFVPPVYLTNLLIFNKVMHPGMAGSPLAMDISMTRKLSLTYKQSSISFYFAALNFTAAQNNRYAYRLEGMDEHWYFTSERKAAYTNLEPGHYVFRVKAANNDGIWNPKESTVLIVIAPPYWGTWWFRILTVVVISAGAYYILSLKKNLDLKKIEKQRIEELHQTKIQFFTNISHEFRTPLSLILGPLETLLDDRQSLSRHYYKIMYRNANRLLSLINELMDFRKVETGALRLKVRSGNLNSFLTELAKEFQDAAQAKSIKLNIEIKMMEQTVLFDPQVIEKIILNLLNNALKYTPVHGKITISLFEQLNEFNSVFENELILKNDTRSVKYGYIRISDNGIGISKESISHLFERYYRIKDTHLGSGIGLALVKSLVVLHKGDLFVHSQRGHGTDIIIGLPVGEQDYDFSEREGISSSEGGISLENLHIDMSVDVSANVENSQKFRPAEACTPTSKRHLILIVEDNDEIRSFLARELKSYYLVDEAIDGRTGLHKTKEILPDLIISDVMMSGMNGVEFCKAIKDDIETSHIPFIMLTAKTNLQAEIEGMQSGADLYLTKPLSIQLLKSSLQNIFEQREILKSRYKKGHQMEHIDLVRSQKDKQFMDRLLELIQINISNPELQIEDLCSELNMGRTKLYRKVKDITGQSPNEFIRTVRLKKAIEILTEEDVLLTEVIYRVGIQTQSYFAKAFKREYGKTPSQYLQELAARSVKSD
ncbi:two-component regulator propeller domain-containing protein [Mucilaginibacter sp. PAMB04274]|uniref:hybrid sensor histidine kinase/response regulator transcription factor n=1 Tax=Mucilaginibacter sp. PAMB04274 TaxID=3138568 RepID=UPI0031F6480A